MSYDRQASHARALGADALLHHQPPARLAAGALLNTAIQAWVEQEYRRTVHSELLRHRLEIFGEFTGRREAKALGNLFCLPALMFNFSLETATK